ncbi:hypothetical protein KQX54_017016 [Cotesia glomerata]|uniref:Uncharacterized protein n=1 Tax=Cotesia glomerata TaxID=32391 RepID=A0AAV7IAJ3_COTGL|nr:hypothetical protein KQX54_017016 [Cotesia glomerata]
MNTERKVWESKEVNILIASGSRRKLSRHRLIYNPLASRVTMGTNCVDSSQTAKDDRKCQRSLSTIVRKEMRAEYSTPLTTLDPDPPSPQPAVKHSKDAVVAGKGRVYFADSRIWELKWRVANMRKMKRQYESSTNDICCLYFMKDEEHKQISSFLGWKTKEEHRAVPESSGTAFLELPFHPFHSFIRVFSFSDLVQAYPLTSVDACCGCTMNFRRESTLGADTTSWTMVQLMSVDFLKEFQSKSTTLMSVG